ncbi:MAG: TonB-dependent receptor, partial [Bryobacteraceae bacterium]
MKSKQVVRLTFSIFLGIWLSWSSAALAQRIKSTLSGVITDASGAPARNVAVRLTNEATNVSTRFNTTENGTFAFPFLDSGTYTIEASLAGFKTVTQRGLVVRVATDQRIDLSIELGQVSERVEVVGQAPLLENVSSALGQVVDNKKISDLPLNGRNVFSLLNLIPGSALGGPAGSGVTATNPSINGTRPRGNSFTIDGVSANQEYAGFTGGAGVASTPQIDAIGEFKVITSNYSAEYGRTMGAVVALSIKSGTNQFHGSAFEFLRNEKFDARNFFASPAATKPVLRFNQFGGSVGGPVIRDKLFFFTNGEWTRRRSTSVSVQTVPTLPMRAGDFSADSVLMYDPTTTRVEAGRTIRTAFPGNRMPASLIDSSSRLLNDYWPAPTSAGLVANYLSVSSTGANVFRHDTKMDYRLSERDSLSGRFSYNDNEIIGAQTFPGPANPNLTAYQHIKAPGFQANYTRTFSPNLINEFRFGKQRNEMAVSSEKSSYDDWRTKLGLPQIFSKLSLQFGFPSIAPTGVGTIGQSTAQFYFFQNTLEFNDTLSWTRGKHFIKVGGFLSRNHAQDYIPSSPSGTYNFSGQFTSLPGVAGTGRGFADFLIGWSNNASALLLSGGGMQPRNTEYAFFLQDDIRLTRTFTLNIGARYDVANAIRTREGTLWGFDPATNTMRRAEPPAPTDRNNLAPRVGFAWEVLPKTVIRSGYGIAYYPQFKGLGGFFGAPPAQQGKSFVAVDAITPGLTLRNNFGPFDETLSQTFVVGAANNVVMFEPGNLRSPYVQSWNFTLERQVGSSLVLSASYVGNKGTHLENIHQANQLPPNLLGPND